MYNYTKTESVFGLSDSPTEMLLTLGNPEDFSTGDDSLLIRYYLSSTAFDVDCKPASIFTGLAKIGGIISLIGTLGCILN